LNDRRDVAIPEVTRARVLETAREMGYRPNRAARALVMGRTQMVAIWQPSPKLACYGEVFDILYRQLRSRGYEAMYCDSREAEAEARSLEWPVDGIIGVDTRALKSDAKPFATPSVSLGTVCDQEGDHVLIDLYPGAAAAVRHLVKEGCRQIVHITRKSDSAPKRGRLAAYRDDVTEAGLPFRPLYTIGYEVHELQEALQRDIAVNGPIDGVFGHNDWIAMASYGALSHLGLQVPKDVLVVGVDDTAYLTCFPTPIASVSLPWVDACAEAVQFLDEKIKDPNRGPLSLTVPSSFVPRESAIRGH
jgi:DNA-binding LacI/PurR family transcriptional regulator